LLDEVIHSPKHPDVVSHTIHTPAGFEAFTIEGGYATNRATRTAGITGKVTQRYKRP
jgi:hypothetical protein